MKRLGKLGPMWRMLGLSFFVLASGSGFAQKKEADVRTVYGRMNVLNARHDARGQVALFKRTAARDFVSVMEGYKMNRARYARNLRMMVSGPNPPTETHQIVGVRRVGTSLVVTLRYKSSIPLADGPTVVMPITMTDTWGRTPAGYRLKRSVTEWGWTGRSN